MNPHIKKLLSHVLPELLYSLPEKLSSLDRSSQELLSNQCRLRQNMESVFQAQYPSLKTQAGQREIFRNAEYSIHSQFGEDGILAYIFSNIGTMHRNVLEIGTGDGIECNSASLIRLFGWHGTLIEGNPAFAERAKAYFANRPEIRTGQVAVINAFIKRETVNELLSQHNIRGDIDLLSIDIDGNDYWIWDSLTVIKPRVVIIEYNASLGPTRSVTIPYNEHFTRHKEHASGWYHGASLAALEKLGKTKGYALVGCEHNGVNAFFIDKKLLNSSLHELTAEAAYYPHALRTEKATINQQFDVIRNMPFTEI